MSCTELPTDILTMIHKKVQRSLLDMTMVEMLLRFASAASLATPRPAPSDILYFPADYDMFEECEEWTQGTEHQRAQQIANELLQFMS